MLRQWIFAICCCKKSFKLIFFEIFTVNIQLLSWLQLSDYVFYLQTKQAKCFADVAYIFFPIQKKNIFIFQYILDLGTQNRFAAQNISALSLALVLFYIFVLFLKFFMLIFFLELYLIRFLLPLLLCPSPSCIQLNLQQICLIFNLICI